MSTVSTAVACMAAAVGEAVPCLIKDVRPLIAAYAVSAWADWDFAGCSIDVKGRRFVLDDGKAGSATGATPVAVPRPAAMSEGWGPTLTEGHRVTIREPSNGFVWIVTREPLRSSGLQRWAVRIDENSGWHLWFGLTGLSAAGVRALRRTDNRNGREVSDPHTITLASDGTWYHSATQLEIRRVPDSEAKREPSQVRWMPWPCAYDSNGNSDYHTTAGGVVVLNVDRHANALQLQWDGPKGPSLPQSCSLPADYPLGEARPCLLLWGPTTRVTELLPPDVFPLPPSAETLKGEAAARAEASRDEAR